MMSPEELAAIEARAESVPNVATHPDEMIRVGESQRDVKPLIIEVRKLQHRSDALHERLGIEVRTKDEWEANAEEAMTEAEELREQRDAALAARDRMFEDRRRADGLLHEARGLLDHDKTEIATAMDRMRERNRAQWEEARTERNEVAAERDRLQATIDRVRDVTDRMHHNATEALAELDVGYYARVSWTAIRADAETIRTALKGGEDG